MPRGGVRPGGFQKGHKINQGRTKKVGEKPVGMREDLVEMIYKTLKRKGGVEYLESLAPKELVALLGRLVPKDLNVNANQSFNLSIYLSTYHPQVPVMLPGQEVEALLTEAIHDHAARETDTLLLEGE